MDSYRQKTSEVILSLDSSVSGLSSSEVIKRQKERGLNVITIKKKVSFVVLILSQFKGYLAWLLLGIAGFAFFAGFFLHMEEQILDGIIISFIVVINAVIGALQEYKSEKSAELLKSMLKTETLVLRDNSFIKIDACELVAGDIITLAEGDKVPADARIISSESLLIDESLLTGESHNVEKNTLDISKEVPLAERKNMVFMNTFVVKGEARCIVTDIGVSTEVGKIAKSLEFERKSVFLKEVDSATKKITFVALFLIIFVLVSLYFKGNNWVTVFMIGAALIVGSIPEGLPAIVTFTLSLASLTLAKNNVLIKRKTLLETLGSVDVLCTDKTGTLTQNKMSVKNIYVNNMTYSSYDMFKKEKSQVYKELLQCALLCNEAKSTLGGFSGSPEDVSLISFFSQDAKEYTELNKKYERIHLEPFSSDTKFVSSEHKIDNDVVRYTKGAPETILLRCKYILTNGKVKLFSKKEKEQIKIVLKNFSADALRNIAFSYKIISSDKNANNKKSNKKDGDVFIGIAGIYDAPKKDIDKTITALYDASIEVKMITGDNIDTAIAIAKECGFRDVKAITWNDIKDFSDEKLRKTVESYNVFARMSPEFKLKIVNALQENGHRVAITGDGVNDAPALKKAEVGICMGKRGSDIAKDAADIILLDDELSSIMIGIKEGRTIFSNIRKVINYLLTANFAEVLVVFVCAMFGFIPFLAIQLLWVNFVTDIAPAMALGIDPSHKEIMTKKPTGKGETLINKRITYLTIFIGLKKVLIMFLVFLISYKVSNNLVLAQTMSFTWLVLSHFVRVAAIRFDEKVSFFANKYLVWAIIIPIVLQIAIIYTPLSNFFHVVPLGFLEWIFLIVSVLVGVSSAKLISYIIDKNIPTTEKDY